MSTLTRADTHTRQSAAAGKEPKAAVDVKGSVFTLTVLRLASNDLAAIQANLAERVSQAPRFFEYAPVVLDLESIKGEAIELNLADVAQICRQLKLIPVGVRNASVEHQQSAISAGLAILRGGAVKDLVPAATAPAAETTAKTTERPQTTSEPESTRRLEAKPAMEPAPAPRAENKMVHNPIRSGQQIYNANGDLTILAAVNAGAEVVADGCLHIYAPLRGRALAGVRGDIKARIFCLSFEAELVSIAGHYRVFEDAVPAELFRRSVQIYLNDKEQLIIEPQA